jgi:Zn-dependent peptidase ImmA (M78 family)
MFNYQSTPLEDDIRKLYHEIGIMEHYQLDMIYIAERLNVWIHFMDIESQAIDRNGLHSMVIDRRLSPDLQWQDFGHELCHVLRQAGKQTDMPMEFLLFQETKADNFALEFCVPSFMLKTIKLPYLRSEAIRFISEAFNVTQTFASRKLEIMQRRVYQGQLDAEFVEMERRRYPKADPDNWTDETRAILNKLYYQLDRKKGVAHNG